MGTFFKKGFGANACEYDDADEWPAQTYAAKGFGPPPKPKARAPPIPPSTRIPQAPSPSSQQESVPVAARSAADAASELLRAWDSALAPAMQIAAEEAGWQDDEDFASLDGVVSAEMDSKAEQLAEELLESLRAGGLAAEPGMQAEVVALDQLKSEPPSRPASSESEPSHSLPTSEPELQAQDAAPTPQPPTGHGPNKYPPPPSNGPPPSLPTSSSSGSELQVPSAVSPSMPLANRAPGLQALTAGPSVPPPAGHSWTKGTREARRGSLRVGSPLPHPAAEPALSTPLMLEPEALAAALFLKPPGTAVPAEAAVPVSRSALAGASVPAEPAPQSVPAKATKATEPAPATSVSAAAAPNLAAAAGLAPAEFIPSALPASPPAPQAAPSSSSATTSSTSTPTPTHPSPPLATSSSTPTAPPLSSPPAATAPPPSASSPSTPTREQRMAELMSMWDASLKGVSARSTGSTGSAGNAKSKSSAGESVKKGGALDGIATWQVEWAGAGKGNRVKPQGKQQQVQVEQGRGEKEQAEVAKSTHAQAEHGVTCDRAGAEAGTAAAGAGAAGTTAERALEVVEATVMPLQQPTKGSHPPTHGSFIVLPHSTPTDLTSALTSHAPSGAPSDASPVTLSDPLAGPLSGLPSGAPSATPTVASSDATSNAPPDIMDSELVNEAIQRFLAMAAVSIPSSGPAAAPGPSANPSTNLKPPPAPNTAPAPSSASAPAPIPTPQAAAPLSEQQGEAGAQGQQYSKEGELLASTLTPLPTLQPTPTAAPLAPNLIAAPVDSPPTAAPVESPPTAAPLPPMPTGALMDPSSTAASPPFSSEAHSHAAPSYAAPSQAGPSHATVVSPSTTQAPAGSDKALLRELQAEVTAVLREKHLVLQALAESREAHAAEISALKAAHAQELKSVHAAHAHELESAHAAHAAAITTLHSKVEGKYMDPRCDRDTELNTDIDMGSDMESGEFESSYFRHSTAQHSSGQHSSVQVSPVATLTGSAQPSSSQTRPDAPGAEGSLMLGMTGQQLMARDLRLAAAANAILAKVLDAPGLQPADAVEVGRAVSQLLAFIAA